MSELVDATRGPRWAVGGRDWLFTISIVAALVGAAFSFWLLYDSTGDFGQIDYRIYSGSAGRYTSGQSIYSYVDPEYHLSATYPPFGLLVFVPISYLNIRVAEVLWLLANVACLVAIARLVCTHMLRVSERTRMLVCLVGPSLAIPTAMMWANFQLGQVNLWIWLAIVADLILIRRNKRFGGVLIGLATAMKLTPAVFIVFLLAAREWKPAARAAAAAATATGVAWALAPSDSRLYWTELLFDTSRIGALGDPRNNSIRFVTTLLPVGDHLQVLLWLAVAAFVVPLGIRRATLAWRGGQDLYAMVIVGCVGALASPISWNHHLIFLLLALLLLPEPGWPRRKQIVVLAAGWVFLVDPVMFGVSAVSSVLRCLAMVAIIAGLALCPTSWLESISQRDRSRADGDSPDRLRASGAQPPRQPDPRA